MPSGRVSRITKGLVHLDLEDDFEVEQSCWIELLGPYPIEIGDVITGNLWNPGKQELQNVSKGYSMRVFVRAHDDE